jgi:peptidyl-prolyl cis-trans isomerase SurA
MNKIARCGILALVVVMVQLSLAKPGAAKVYDRIVAVVNNDIITLSELDNMTKAIQARSGMPPTGAISKKMQRRMLQALIDRKLAREEAKRRGITVSANEVNKTLKRFEQSNNIPNDQALAKMLANQGLSYKEFRQQIKDQLIQDRLVALTVGSKIIVSDAEVRRVYNEKFKTGGAPAQVHLLDLKMPYPPGATEEQKDATKQTAAAIITAVKQGVPFTQAASKFSLTPTDVGYVSKSDLDPRLAKFLDNLKPNQVGPVSTPGGLQLIQIIGRRSGDAPSFKEVAPQIRDMLMHKAMEKEFTKWVKTLRDKAHIRVML